MNQQAFYRDTAIGEWLEDGSYRSWGQRRRTLQVQQHRRNQAMSHLLQNVGLAEQKWEGFQNSKVSWFDWVQPKQEGPWRMEGLQAFFDDSITKTYKPPGMTYEERFGRSGD